MMMMMMTFYCYYSCTINWTNLPYFNVITDARTTCKQRHAKLFLRLAQSSPIGRLNRAKNRASGNAMVTYNVAARLQLRVNSSCNLCYTFCKFFVNSKFYLATKYTFKAALNNHSVDILSVRRYCQIFIYESNTFLCYQYTQKPHSNKWTRKPPKTTPSLSLSLYLCQVQESSGTHTTRVNAR